MEKTFLSLALAVVCIPFSLVTSVCPDDWTPFNDEKCFFIASHAGVQTQEDAEIICQSYTNSSDVDPCKLLTIKTHEEQHFVHDFLFVRNGIIDHVWLGLKSYNNSQIFEWNDGSDLDFTNWADHEITDKYHRCVQMESGGGNDPPGAWVQVNCDKRNAVVCEKSQKWTFENIQSIVVNLKMRLQRAENGFERFKAAAEEEIETLKNNSAIIPVGFIYVQLGGQAEPATLWPSAIWKDVSSSYEGLFFRVVGEDSSKFGTIQEGSSPRLANVDWRKYGAYDYDYNVTSIPTNGNWSNYVYTGTSYSGPPIGIRFQSSDDEVRPRNQAVKVWVRTE